MCVDWRVVCSFIQLLNVALIVMGVDFQNLRHPFSLLHLAACSWPEAEVGKSPLEHTTCSCSTSLRTTSSIEMPLSVSLQSFLLLRDGETSQPSLLCVSTGGENEEVVDYRIKCTGTVFQLSESRLGFSDLAQLVLFYSLTRDVVAVCLSVPQWIYNETDQTKARLSQLEPKTWLCAPSDLQTDHMTHREPSTVMCSIQLTSANGALCVINPLYLREHGDDWLTRRPASPQSPNYRRERRLSTTRPWGGAGLHSKRAISLDQEGSTASAESSGLIRAQSADSPHCPPTTPTPAAPAQVVLRRPSRDAASNPPWRLGSQESLPPSTPSTPGTPSCSVSELHHSSPVPQSPCRVSWIEDGVWLPPPRPLSSLQPPSLELDSLSISSIEEELECQLSSPAPTHPSAQRLADKVIHRLSAVGQAIGGLVCQQKKLTNRVLELSERKGGAFAEATRGFLETTLRGGVDPAGVTGSEFLQEVRASLTALRETLLDCTEIQVLLDSMTDTPDLEMDSMVELSLHKVALKPIVSHLYSSLQTSRSNDSSLPRLRANQRVLEGRGVEELGGSAGAGVPDPPTLERMQQRWSSMRAAYSPSKKVQILLKVCKSIYHSMSANASPGMVFGADDFLPCLTWVLLRSDVVTLQLDTDYMMELLDPTQLQGEGGYYLTSLYASLYYISSFKPRLAVRQLSAEAQQSLNQWHRRRTLHCNQSRRSKNRRTIRRQPLRKSSETEAGSQQEDESGKGSESGDVAEAQQQTESNTEGLEPVREETGGGQEAEDQSAAPASRQETLLGKEDDGQSVSRAGEERKKEAEGEKEHPAVHQHDVCWTQQLEIH
ncbi:ras and Rab interactor 2 isoform X1 [Centroberyx affinis]|uniref:ras and Rab interactor 2 isoform X1 n=1 Tax=Centroberyx affinis TaxID=166261 RepID=UPI003A5BB6CB